MKFYFYLIAIICFVGSGVYLGYRLFSPAAPRAAATTSQTIVNAFHEEGFLVTESYVLNEKVTIDQKTGSAWKDFFWGQTIDAEATMKVNAGVDLTKIEANDISVTGDTVTLRLPNLQEQSVEVVGNITLTNKQGVLKRLFNNDDGYNVAYEKLRSEAQGVINTPEFQTAAQESTKKQITTLLRFLIGERSIVVTF